jgi:hypothetical protein
LSTTGARAQSQVRDSTLNRTVVVEQEYNPTISDAVKVNAVPRVLPPTAVKQQAEYDIQAQPADNVPAGIMPVYTMPEAWKRAGLGFVRLGYGNNGNLDAAAALDWLSPGKNDRLTARIQLDGMNGNLKIDDADVRQVMQRDTWGAYRYHTHADADYTHLFPKLTLTLGGNYDLHNFNYLSYPQSARSRLTSNDVHLELRSTGDNPRISYHAGVTFASYKRQDADIINEHNWLFSGGMSVRLSPEQCVGVDAEVKLITTSLDNRQVVDLTPYYQFGNRAWRIRLGLHTDFSSGGGRGFNPAPDVTATYSVAKGALLYAQAKGGRVLNDLRRLEHLSLYGNTTLSAVADAHQMPGYSYERINAAVGFKATPTDGLWFNLYLGMQAWYQDILLQKEYTNISDGYYTGTAELPGYTLRTGLAQADTRNLYAGGELRYAYKELFTLTADAVYRNWKLTGGEEAATDRSYLLSFKPLLEANVRADVRPVPALLLTAGYHHISRNDANAYNAVSNLYVSGSYQITNALSVYARFNNLLNSHYSYRPG